MKISFRIGAFLTFLILSVQGAYACSCVPRSLEEKIAAAGFVFVGKVVGITEDTSQKRQPYESRRYLVKLKIIENFKGAKAGEINLVQYEIKRRTSCPDWNLAAGKTYLIFANQTGKDIRHQVACSPTQRFDADSGVYKELIRYKAEKTRRKK